ncbi:MULTISPECIES: lipoprotein [unclassified Spiroplasma]|uniref:lipoprotein n=1 Tax=unclassified Spiroplasma TaxID=2637901 RepID=UPI00313AF00D
MKKILNLLGAVNLVAIGLISVVSCGSSRAKINPIAKPKSAEETINDDPTLGDSNPNNFKFDLSKISQKKILLDETSNDEFLTKQSILETDISEKVKRAVLELLKENDNSLTENDFIVDFSQNFPVDIRNETNINIKAKVSEKNNNNNNAEIIINIKRGFYTDVKIISIESPQKIIANDPTKVTKEELKTALLPEILKALEKLNPGFPNTVNKNYISIKKFEIEDINFPLDLSSEKILTKFNINFEFISGVLPVLVFAPNINLNNFKLPMALKN